MTTFNLRPHHGLCLHFFQGEGYSEEFIQNMQNIVDTLATNPTIHLITANDDVCRTCPNRVNETECACDKKVLHYDKRVVELCNLTLNSTLSWNDFSIKVYNNILSPNLRETVCGDCEWNHLCHSIHY